MGNRKSSRFLSEIRFRKLRHDSSARHFIGTGSRRSRNIDKPARGGNGRSSANICQAFRSKTCSRSTYFVAAISGGPRRSEIAATVEATPLADIFRRDAEGRTDRDGRHRDPGPAGDDVQGRSGRSTECAGPHFRQDAEALHSDRPRRQSFGRALSLRSDQGANHLPRAMTALRAELSVGRSF